MPLELIATTAPTVDRTLWTEGALNATDAAAFLGVSRRHVFDLMQRGVLPWGRLGGRRMIPRRALVDLLAQSGGPQ